MRTITTTKFADAVRHPKIKYTFENDRPTFYVADNPGPTLAHASDRFVAYDCSVYSGGLLEILVAYGVGAYSDVVYYRFTASANMADPTSITWGAWAHFHASAAVFSANLYEGRLYLGRANATTTTAAVDYTDFNGTAFGACSAINTNIGKGNIGVAPLSATNRLIVRKKALVNSVYTNSYVLAALDGTCELGYPNVGFDIGNMQAIQVGTDIYVYFNEKDDEAANQRVLYYKLSQADGVGQSFNGWSSVKYVVPMDVVDDLTSFTMGGLTVLDNKVFISGILKRADGPLMHVYTIGPEKFTMGRNMFIAGVNPGDGPGKLIRIGDTIFYMSNGYCYWSELTRLMSGTSISTFSTEEIANAQVQYAVNTPANISTGIHSALQSSEIVAGADLDVALDFGDGYETVSRFSVDGLIRTKTTSGKDLTIRGRGKAMKDLASWESDAPYDYWSQAKLQCNPTDLAKVIRLTGMWKEVTSELYPERLNEDSILYVAERSCRNGMISARFMKSVAYTSTAYAKFGVGLSFSLESKYDAGVRLGKDASDVDDNMLLRNGLIAMYRGDTERVYLVWLKDNVQWLCNWTGGTADGTASYASLPLTVGHKYWMQMKLHEGTVTMMVRDDNTSVWTTLFTCQPSCDIGSGQQMVNIPTPETGARGVLYMRNCTPNTTLSRTANSTDKDLCTLDTSSFPASGNLLVNSERMSYCAKVGAVNLRARAQLASVNPAESARSNDSTNGNYTVLNFGNDDTTYRIKRVLTWSGGATYPNTILTTLPIGKVGNPQGLRIKIYNGSNALQETILVDGSAIASVGTYGSDRLFPGLTFSYKPKTFATTWYFIIEPAAGVSDAANYFKYLGYTPAVASTYKGTKASSFTMSNGEIIYVQNRASIGLTPTSIAFLTSEIPLASAAPGTAVFVENDALAGKLFAIKSAAISGSYTVITMTESIGNMGYLVNNAASANMLWPNCNGTQLIEYPYTNLAAKFDLDNRALDGTLVSSHSVGDTVHLYSALPFATVDSLVYFSDEIDLCLKDMVEEIARKAGVLSVSSRLLSPVNGLYPGRNFIVDFAPRTYADAANHILIEARKRDAVITERLLNPGFEASGASDLVLNSSMENMGQSIDLGLSNGGFETAFSPSVFYTPQNPGFETAGGGGADVFQGWIEHAGDGTIARDTTIYSSGAASCKLTCNTTDTTDPPYVEFTCPCPTLEKGPMWLKCDVRTEAIPDKNWGDDRIGTVQVWQDGEEKEWWPIGDSAPDTWLANQCLSRTYHYFAVDSISDLTFRFYGPKVASKSVWIDNVSIVQQSVSGINEATFAIQDWYGGWGPSCPALDTGIKRTGNSSLKLISASGNSGTAYRYIPVTPGHSYKISFYARGGASPEWKLSNVNHFGTPIRWLFGTESTPASLSGCTSSTWKLCTYFATSEIAYPHEANYMKLEFFESSTTVAAWFDDVVVEDVTEVFDNWDCCEEPGAYTIDSYCIYPWTNGDTNHASSQCAMVISRRGNTYPSGGDYPIYMAQNFGVVPGHRYNFTFWHYADSSSYPGRYSFWDVTHNTSLVALTNATNPVSVGWGKHTSTISIPTGCTSVRLFLYAAAKSSTSAVAYDDVNFFDIDNTLGWIDTHGDGSALVTTAAGEYHSGVSAKKITNGPNKSTSISQCFEVLPGQAYNLSFWTRGDAGAGHAGRYKVLDAVNNVDIIALTDSGITGTTYTNVISSFIVPKDCDQVTIIFYGNDLTTGSVFYDDVSITEPSVILNIEDNKITYLSGTTLREEYPLSARLQGALRVSLYEEYLSVWNNEKLVVGFELNVIDRSCLGGMCTITGATPIFYEANRRIDNFILDNGKKGDQLISELIGEKRFYVLDDNSGGLQLFQSRTAINTNAAPYVLSTEVGSMDTDSLAPTRVRVEGAEVYEKVDLNAMRTYGNVFSLKHMNEVNSLLDAQENAEIILDDLSHRYKMHTLNGALDPRIEPMDEIHYSNGSEIIHVIVDTVTYNITASSEGPIYDNRLECREI